MFHFIYKKNNASIPWMLTFLLIFQLLSTIPSYAAPANSIINVPITVKECAMTGSNGYTITTIVPFAKGDVFDTSAFSLHDSSGQPVLAQFEVLNRWWSSDNSLRHVAVHFQPNLNASTPTYTEEAIYHLKNDSLSRPNSPLEVTETTENISVMTGPLQFDVSKNAFSIIDSLYMDSNQDGSFDETEHIILPNSESGGLLTDYLGQIQKDQDRNDITVTVEEYGPVRTIIKAEAKTIFTSTEDLQHGWAVRIYAYANQPYVKVDYQLQNSDKDVVYSWPLYFEDMNLQFDLNMNEDKHLRIGAPDGSIWSDPQEKNVTLAQKDHASFEIQGSTMENVLSEGTITSRNEMQGGFMDISDGSKGVTSSIRHFWQMWPNGLSVDDQNKLSIELFPHWSAQWNRGGGLNDTGLFWLEDMQHVYKEVLLNFHDGQASDAELRSLIKTFECPPVATLPTSYYQETKATLDMGGIIPENSELSETDVKVPQYPAGHYDQAVFYGFNWLNFGDPEPVYRAYSSQTGGWPYSAVKFVLSGNPKDYYKAEEWGIGEVNTRPQSLPHYNYDSDNTFLRLTDNPYAGGFWRAAKYPGLTSYDGYLAAPRIEGTSKLYKTRDDEHAWFGHVEESYYLTGNPWVKDWYEFVGEFRKIRLERTDPYPDTSSRATGHALDHLLQAYRITGDLELLEGFHDHLITYLRPEQSPQHGIMKETVERSGGGFQTGFLNRTIIDYMEIVKDTDPQKYAEAFQYLAGFVEWNTNLGNFPYYHRPWDGEPGQSGGPSLTQVDPQAWFYWHTGDVKYLDHLNDYLDDGINGGRRPYGEFDSWEGQYESRYLHYVKTQRRSDFQAPVAITDLSINTTGSQAVVEWTEPDDVSRYHLLYSDKPIMDAYTLDVKECNWWAANVLVPDITSTPGQKQSFVLPVNTEDTLYARIVSFDDSFNMSDLSNQVENGVIPNVVWSGWDYNGELLALDGYELLVDFGSTAENTDFGRYDWTSVFKDQYTDYRSYGGGGTCIITGDNYAYNYQGVTGSDVSFNPMDGMKVVWYNHLDETVTFTPNISFNDNDRIRSGMEGTWYPMTQVTIPAKSYGITEFEFSDDNADNYNMVNVNVNYSSRIGLMCDKIFFCIN